MKLWLLLFCATLVLQFYGSKSCFQEEKKALLDFKKIFKYRHNSGDPLLPSWVSKPNSNCCAWERVTCEITSGHVIQLSLGGLLFVDNYVSLNLSLLLSFRELRSIHLSNNHFNGWSLSNDYRDMSTLKVLETIDLSSNAFDRSIMKPLSELTSLKNLNLANNNIIGSFPFQEISVLENLQSLDLYGNQLSTLSTSQGVVSQVSDFNNLSGLTRLKTLNLAGNEFDKEIFKYLVAIPALRSLFLHENNMTGNLDYKVLGNLANLSNLEVLILRSNKLVGPLPQGLCEMKNLRELDLSHNFLEGPLTTCLKNLSSIQGLDISSNYLTENISSSLFASLKSLEYLSFSQNQFEGLFALNILANHSNLKLLSIGMQKNNYHVDTENPPWVPQFQLEALDMASCKLNMPTGSIPSFLFYQHDLQYIDLSGNNLVGIFPNWLFINNLKLEFVLLNDNSFTEELKFHTILNQGMQWNRIKLVKISNNDIRGQLPQDIGSFFPNLEYLNASNNALVGEIPASFGKMTALHLLDLSYNNISGVIPTQLLTGCISLSHLKLSYNSLSGPIIHRPLNLFNLNVLLLDHNHFNGTLQEGLLDLIALATLGLSGNMLSGNLPSWIGHFSGLRAFCVQGNNFSGLIPEELCKLDLVYINLSDNRFSGSIPPCFNMTRLWFLHLQKNSLSGSIPKALLRSPNLMTLDLGGNRLSGSIPDWIHGLNRLRALLLKGNNLQGQIPNLLCQLKELRLLDLSYNKLSGKIPACFCNMSFGKGQVNFDSSKNFSKFISYIYGADYFFGFQNSFGDFLVSTGSAEELEFRTKTTLLSYQGEVLNYMSILDLSSNQFTGEIPWQLGDLAALHSLNLSHNLLNGSLPKSFHKLRELESLDLSCNRLSGDIPPQLQELHFLAFFNVSYNNFSGSAPDKEQFATFGQNSYQGNPLLSWSIENNGRTKALPTPSGDVNNEDDESGIDMGAFYCSLGASYLTVLLALITIICISPQWRMAWYNFIDRCFYKCFHRFLKNVY